MALAKYQADSLAKEVLIELKKKEKEILQNSEYQSIYDEELSSIKEDIDYERYSSLLQEQSELNDRLSDIKSELQDIRRSASTSVNSNIRIYQNNIDEVIETEAKKKALNRFNFSLPSINKIRDAVIVADLSDAGDIIEVVKQRFL